MRLERSARRRARTIGLTPLIDVVFILLLFFMLASRLTPLHSVPLQAPGAGEEDALRSAALLLRIGTDGGLDLNGEALTAAELEAALQTRLARRPDLEVVVEPADGVALQRTLRVLDRLTEAGVAGLQLR